MKHLRVIDETGSKSDYEAEFVPRIGERILLAEAKKCERAR
jgi:hypothetical protein